MKYTLEALSVNEVGSGLIVKDLLQGVPDDVSASLNMNLVRCLAITCGSRIKGYPLLAISI